MGKFSFEKNQCSYPERNGCVLFLMSSLIRLDIFLIKYLPDFRLIVDCPTTPAVSAVPAANELIIPVGTPDFDEISLAFSPCPFTNA